MKYENYNITNKQIINAIESVLNHIKLDIDNKWNVYICNSFTTYLANIIAPENDELVIPNRDIKEICPELHELIEHVHDCLGRNPNTSAWYNKYLTYPQFKRFKIRILEEFLYDYKRNDKINYKEIDKIIKRYFNEKN